MAVQGAYTFEEGGRRRRKKVEKVNDGSNRMEILMEVKAWIS